MKKPETLFSPGAIEQEKSGFTSKNKLFASYPQRLWITLWIDCYIHLLIAVFITVLLNCIKTQQPYSYINYQ
jgi:hypothetical protein